MKTNKHTNTLDRTIDQEAYILTSHLAICNKDYNNDIRNTFFKDILKYIQKAHIAAAFA